MESWAKPQGNLDAAGTTRRLRAGVMALAVALGIAVVMAKADVSVGYRLLLFLPFFAAANGFFQGLYRT
jgi:hypothetical protein